jgi:hypothetical protein
VNPATQARPDVVTISRSKLYPTPGRNYRVAWKWLYEVTVPGEPRPFIGEGIGWAMGIAKRKGGGRSIVKTWEKG